MTDGTISIENPGSPEVRAILERHLAFANAHSPRENVHALDVDGLLDARVAFFGLRVDGTLVAVGALKELDRHHAELKSMHTAEEVRRRGLGAQMLEHLIGLAGTRGFQRLSLETGSMQAFAPARSLYATAGFESCGPFGQYVESSYSTFMTLSLAAGA
ncbi:MAG: GNAT family N-acetyltransferase [Actinomycetota bacterium]